jgi:hypothetical protein
MVSPQHSSPAQAALVLDHLQNFPSITPLEALQRYGCFRLAARIYELRDAGHSIVTHRMHAGAKRNVAVYVLVQSAKGNPYRRSKQQS